MGLYGPARCAVPRMGLDVCLGAESRAATLAVFNDTHDADPITVGMRLEVAGKKVSDENREFAVTPGGRKEFKLDLKMPVVDARQEGRLVLSISVRGKKIWSDTKAVSILPDAAAGDRLGLATDDALCVFDPAGGVAAFLKGRAVPFAAVKSLASLPKSAKVLVVGKDAIDTAESTSSRLAAFASDGRAVIVLEQTNPLKYQAVPAKSKRPRTSAASLLPRISTIRYFVVSPKRISSLGAPMRFSSAMPT